MLKRQECEEVLSLMLLLDDSDPETVSYVNRRFAELGEEAVVYLSKAVKAEYAGSRQCLGRLMEIEDWLTLSELEKRSVSGFPDLPDAMYLVSRIGINGLDRRYFMDLFVQIAFRMVMDINVQRTGVENIEIFNYHFFRNYGILSTPGGQTEDNSVWLPKVLEARRAYPVLLSLLYIMLARNAGLPVYPALLGNARFAPAYTDGKGNPLFLMNIMDRGYIHPLASGRNSGVKVLGRDSAIVSMYAENAYVHFSGRSWYPHKLTILKKVMSLCGTGPVLRP